MQLKDRERKLDINGMSPEEVDVLGKQLGDKIRQICDKAVLEANRLLNVYGMNAKMQIQIQHPDLAKNPMVQEEPKKKRGRPRKVSQSLT